MVRGSGRMDGRSRRRRTCGRAALWASVGGRRAPLRRSRRDARLRPGARARRDGAEVQSAAHGPGLMEATINGARIHYERTGAGIPLLLLHAGVADHRMWEPQVAVMARHFDCITPDMRGFGQSELPPTKWSPVRDLLELVDELDLKPAHVIGCSMGGGLAIDFAVEHPERISKLVLVGPGISGGKFGEKYPELERDIEAAF